MKEFTKAYRRHRLAAADRGEGFMTFKIAEARLRKALTPAPDRRLGRSDIVVIRGGVRRVMARQPPAAVSAAAK
jgi:hypothetical protein